MKAPEKKFRVEGRGPFPVDMLRHDRCWPDTAADAIALECTLEQARDVRSVTLATIDKWSPNRARWLSFGWPVQDERP